MRRRVALVILVVVAGGLFAGCGRPEREAVRDLRAALARTERLSHRFEYQEENLVTGTTNRVLGVVEDDFRYKVRLEVDGQPALDEVVYDDAVADRFYDGAILKSLLRGTAVEPAKIDDPDVASPAQVRAALNSSQWVVDPVGAPALFPASNETRQVGTDPVLDAQTVFDYVERVARVQPVRKFNPDALDYKPKEDPFPKPARDSDVIRYDFMQFPVPKPSDSSSTGRQAVPDAPSFRKMSVYVKDGVVIRVLELMDVAGRLDDIQRNYEVELSGSTREQVKTAIDAINAVRRGQGEREDIRVRKIDFRLLDAGKPQSVELPREGVKGSLAMLVNRGKVKAGSTSGGGDAAASGASSDSPATADATEQTIPSSTP